VSRLGPLQRENVDETGQKLWDFLVRHRGSEVLGSDGGLIGPFNPWMYSPKVAERLVAVGTALRFNSSLDGGLVELATITIAARWRSEVEWWAHTRHARGHGISEEVIAGIGDGETPVFDDPKAELVYRAAVELSRSARLSDELFAAAHTVFGPQGLVELVALCGYYTLVAFTLEAFQVNLPDGVAEFWKTV
jgi:4-carboxymuconolactone decarboxylase